MPAGVEISAELSIKSPTRRRLNRSGACTLGLHLDKPSGTGSGTHSACKRPAAQDSPLEAHSCTAQPAHAPPTPRSPCSRPSGPHRRQRRGREPLPPLGGAQRRQPLPRLARALACALHVRLTRRSRASDSRAWQQPAPTCSRRLRRSRCAGHQLAMHGCLPSVGCRALHAVAAPALPAPQRSIPDWCRPPTHPICAASWPAAPRDTLPRAAGGAVAQPAHRHCARVVQRAPG